MNVRLVSKVALGLMLGFCALGAAAAIALPYTTPKYRPGWAGSLNVDETRVHNSTYYYGTRIDVFVDNNGCEYIVARASSYDGVGVSITPRINSATKQPFCRTT